MVMPKQRNAQEAVMDFTFKTTGFPDWRGRHWQWRCWAEPGVGFKPVSNPGSRRALPLGCHVCRRRQWR